MFFFLSCSGFPDEKQAEIDAKSVTSEMLKSNYELLEFIKTNAVEKDDPFLGLKIYEIEFKGKIKYLKDAYFYKYSKRKDISSLYSYEFELPKGIFGDILDSKIIEKKYDKINKNTIKEVTGSIGYVKKENGWEVQKSTKGNRFVKIKIIEK